MTPLSLCATSLCYNTLLAAWSRCSSVPPLICRHDHDHDHDSDHDHDDHSHHHHHHPHQHYYHHNYSYGHGSEQPAHAFSNRCWAYVCIQSLLGFSQLASALQCLFVVCRHTGQPVCMPERVWICIRASARLTAAQRSSAPIDALAPPSSPYPQHIEPSPVDSNGTASTDIEEDAQDDAGAPSPLESNMNDEAGEVQSPIIEMASPQSATSVCVWRGCVQSVLGGTDGSRTFSHRSSTPSSPSTGALARPTMILNQSYISPHVSRNDSSLPPITWRRLRKCWAHQALQRVPPKER